MFYSSFMPYAALVAFTALGANLLGTGLLILINPGSRSVRWHAAFTVWIMAWLAVQGWFAFGMGSDALLRAYGWTVHLMPGFFFAAALVDTMNVRDRTALAVVALAVVTAEPLNPVAGGSAALAWQVFMWGGASVLHFRNRTDGKRRGGRGDAGERALKLALLVIVPIAVIGVVMARGSFLLYAMPLITIMIQFLIFIGVVHHRFYDIEVRAARSGDLAARGAEQERLALLGELSATLAHEIRNPLAGMRSLTQRLGEPAVDDDRRTRYARVILGEIGRLERIVGNLLDLARRSTVADADASVTALEPLFDDLLLLVDGRARRAQVRVERDAARLSAAAPRDALAQSLLNLLINAVTHTPPGGTIRLSARPVAAGVEVRVSDTGPGVPLEARERIFDPFHTRGLGAGLGLAVVRRTARELGWTVGVRDASGGGACFYIVIPASAPAPSEAAARSEAMAAAAVFSSDGTAT
jgi:signal transduction histidine kinase